jgi:phytoene/squalene synthetase
MYALPSVDRAKQQGGLIMAKIYMKLLGKIENSNFDVLNNRCSISTINKLWITWKTIQTEKKQTQPKELAATE